MRTSIGLGLLGAVLLVVPQLLGCVFGSAELVRRDQYGGTLALHGHRGQAMEDAQQQMAAHCGGAFTIVQEEQVVVGQQTQSGSRTDYGESHNTNSTAGSAQTNSTTTTSNVTEYHITYQCGGAAPPPAAPPPAAAPTAPPPGAAPQAQPAY